MSRILADAKPAPPRVGCVLLRCRLGARGRDGSTAPLGELERRSLVEELGVIAGGVDPETLAPEIFFVDPSEKTDQYGGFDGWARCVKGYLNARGYAATVAVGPDRASALAAARSRWGVVVLEDRTPPRGRSPYAQGPIPRTEVRETTALGLVAPRPTAPRKGQLGLPGLVLGRPRRTRRPKPGSSKAA